jgi:signal recognition particle subunit SRP54
MPLGEKLRSAMESLRHARVLDRDAVREAVRDIQRALISADVEVSLVLELSKRIEQEALKEKLPGGLNRREHVLKVAFEELVKLLGGEGKPPPEKPERILLVGLFGSGKTTTVAKLAKYYVKRGLKVAVIAADTFRPAAFEQLQQLAEKAKIAFYGEKGEKNAAVVIERALKKLKGYDLLIADSAGRNAFDEGLVKEIKEIHAAFKPDNSWLVLGADMGQLAKKQAVAFHEAVGVNGVIITRTDGSAKGGGALAACNETNSAVYFIGTGEKLDDLEQFNAERYLSRIMGYGDLQALLEKARDLKEEISPEELFRGEFNLDTFYKQLEATRKMGPLSKVAEMMGLKMQLPREMLELTEEKLGNFRVIMDSMTKEEKMRPEKLNKSRIVRIARGSGRSEAEVRELLKQFKQMQRLFKKFKKIGEGKLEKMAAEGKGLDLGNLMRSFGFVKKKKKKHFR